jgi:competence protein ComEA
VRAGRSGSGPPDAVAAPLRERAALLLGDGGQAPSGEADLEEEPRSGPVSDLAPELTPDPVPSPAPSTRPAKRVVVAARAPALAGLLGPPEKQEVLLPRAAAMASARDAVRQSRVRRAAARDVESRAAPSVHAVRADEPPGRAVSGDEGAHAATHTTAAAPPARPPVSASPASAASRGRASRLGLAVRERLPLWVQLRCGVEFKTLLALVVVLVVAVGFAVHHFWAGRPEAVRAPRVSDAPAEQALPDTGAAGRTARGSGQQAPGKRLVVDVAGKVRRPGIYRLPGGARVADALESAGGVRPGTDVSGLNRARRLVDGEQIVAGGAPAAGGAGKAPGGAAQGTGATGSGASGGTVSLNSATVEQLETLPGVGPVLAQHILDFREEHGGFTSVDQLNDVNGIGARRFADIEPRVSP